MRFLWFLLLCLGTIAAHCDEIRILIDVSGSMKQTDPNNLRAPALRLLLELLPPGSRAGVWLFAEETQPLIPPAPVNQDWKQQATRLSERIHARGRYTDIEKALESVIGDWQGNPATSNRHLILLTDGMVDVAGPPQLDALSRDRILQNLLPRLQQLGVHLYTIALSDQADHALLKQLAVATDGWNEIVRSAEQLQRTFLRIFKKAVPRDTLPLEENRFQVDSNVKEFTLLVFRRSDSPVTQLVKPSGQRWTFEDHPETVRWHREAGYDLITVANPVPGQWHLIAKVDPDNQVMIVTDLRLKVNPLPNYLETGESLQIRAELTEHGQRITRENFLRLVTLQLHQKGNEQASWTLTPTAEGVYEYTLDPPTEAGTYVYTLTANGKTFQRSWEQSIEVIDNPVRLETIAPSEAGGEAILHLIPNPEIVDPARFQATAVPTKGGQPIPFVPDSEGRWEARIKVDQASTTINLQVQAWNRDGQALNVAFKPIVIEAPPAKPKTTEIVPDDEDLEALPEESEAELEEEEAPQANWWLTAAIAGGINLLLGLSGFLVWRWYRKRIQKQREILLERLA